MSTSRLAACVIAAGTLLAACNRDGTVTAPVRAPGAPSLATASVSPAADLQLSGSASTGSPAAGTTFSYTFLVKNGGPDAAGAVTFTDALPAGTTFLGATVPTWSGLGGPIACGASTAGGTTTVTCGLGSMTKGGQATIVVTVTAPVTAGTFASTGVVASGTADPNPANDAVTVSAQVKTALAPAACPLPAGQVTLHGLVMFTGTTLLPTGPSIQDFALMADDGVEYWVVTNFYDGSRPLTNVINLDCRTSPAQFIATGGFVTVTGTVGDPVNVLAGAPPMPTIGASVVQVPTHKDKF